MKRLVLSIVTLVAIVLFAAVPAGSQTAKAADLVKVNLQLKWVDQAQFAGFYAAVDQGFYKAQGLDVTLLPGGPGRASRSVAGAPWAHRRGHRPEA